MPDSLATLTKATRMLAECRSLPDIKDIRDKAEAVRQYAKAAGEGLEAQNYAAEVKLRAQWRAGELLGEMVKRNGARDGKTGLQDETPLLADIGISKVQSHRWQTQAKAPPKARETFIAEACEHGRELTDKAAYTLGKQYAAQTAHEPPQDSTTGVAADLAELAGQQFGCIYADPPWQYSNQGTRAATDNHYPTMPLDDICAMPVKNLAADDAHLHLWTTNAFMFDALQVIEAWGFEYRSCFVWVKPQMGIGNYWRVSHEFLMLGIRGRATAFYDRSMPSWGQFDRTRHSAKPEEVRAMIERASRGPYLELFGRRSRDGWTVFGNQIEKGLFPA